MDRIKRNRYSRLQHEDSAAAEAAAAMGKLGAEALASEAVCHPYLQLLISGGPINIELALRDFATEYGHYSHYFVSYVSAITDNLTDPAHKVILQANLAEELGEDLAVGGTAGLDHSHGVELPPDVAAGIAGVSHASLYRRFQSALGTRSGANDFSSQLSPGKVWSQQFMALCKSNACAGIGALGFGTELIVSKVYEQILQALKAHSALTIDQRVFFELHSACDDEHAAQILAIAEELARDEESRRQIEQGARLALALRVKFWDAMLERALKFSSARESAPREAMSLGY